MKRRDDFRVWRVAAASRSPKSSRRRPVFGITVKRPPTPNLLVASTIERIEKGKSGHVTVTPMSQQNCKTGGLVSTCRMHAAAATDGLVSMYSPTPPPMRHVATIIMRKIRIRIVYLLHRSCVVYKAYIILRWRFYISNCESCLRPRWRSIEDRVVAVLIRWAKPSDAAILFSFSSNVRFASERSGTSAICCRASGPSSLARRCSKLENPGLRFKVALRGSRPCGCEHVVEAFDRKRVQPAGGFRAGVIEIGLIYAVAVQSTISVSASCMKPPPPSPGADADASPRAAARRRSSAGRPEPP